MTEFHRIGLPPRKNYETKRLYECTAPNCTLSFERKAHLDQHEDIHNNILEYECFYCQYRINDRWDFVEHLLNHFDELDYSCEICGDQLSSAGNLEKHMEQHNDRKHKCSICGELSRTYRIHKYHMQRKHKEIREDYWAHRTVIRPEEDTEK